MKKYQSGNALIYILIAVFLLGGLTVLLSRTSNQTDDTGSTEQLSMQSSELMKYASGLQTAVSNLQLAGCSENDISFEHASADGYLNASSSDRCKVFGTNAGTGITYKNPNTAWLDSAQSAQIDYALTYFTGNVNVVSVGTTSPDMLMIVPYITKSLCSQINRSLGVSVIPQDNGPYSTAQYAARKYTGTFTSSATLGDDTSLTDYAKIIGAKSMCVQTMTAAPVTNTYFFYQTLIAR